MLIFKIAIRNVLRHRVRSLISIASISFGCISVIFIAGYIENIYEKMSDSYIKGRTGHLQISRKGYTKNNHRKPFDYMIENPAVIKEKILSQPHVQRVVERINIRGLISADGNSGPCLIEGIDLSADTSVSTEKTDRLDELFAEKGVLITEGDNFDNQNMYQTILGKGLARALGISVQEGITIMVNTAYGGLNALDLISQGVFMTSYKAYDDRTIRIPLETAKELIDVDSIHTLVVYLDETKKTAMAKKNLTELFKENTWNLEIQTWRELNDFYVKTEELFDQMFWVIKIVLGIIIILSIYNTLNMAVLERISEIGTMRSLGSKRKRIVHLFLMEAVILGIVGGFIGVLFGSLVTFIISQIGIPMPPPPGAEMGFLSEPALNGMGIATAFLLAIITSIVASVLPSYKASRLDIAEALRHCN